MGTFIWAALFHAADFLQVSSRHQLSRVPPPLLSAEIKHKLRAQGILTDSSLKVHLTQGTKRSTDPAEQNCSELQVASVYPEGHLVVVPESGLCKPGLDKDTLHGPRTHPRLPRLAISVKSPKFLPGCPGRCSGWRSRLTPSVGHPLERVARLWGVGIHFGVRHKGERCLELSLRIYSLDNLEYA